MEIESLAKALKVLGEPTRLSIFDMLMEGVHCNCEIAERLGLSLSLVSHHLGALSQHGLIYGERASSDARWIYYRIDREALEQLTGAIDQMLDGARIKPRQPVCGHPAEGDAKTPGK